MVRTFEGGKQDQSAFRRTVASDLAATSRLEDRRKTRHEARGSTEDFAPDGILGDILSVQIHNNPISQTSFDDSTEPPEAPGKTIGDALIDKSAEVPKPRRSPLEIRVLIPPAGGLLHAGSTIKHKGPSSLHNGFLGAFKKRPRRRILV
jgi:hypothetical protein